MSESELLKIIDNDVLTCIISKPNNRENHDKHIIDLRLY